MIFCDAQRQIVKVDRTTSRSTQRTDSSGTKVNMFAAQAPIGSDATADPVAQAAIS